MGRLVSHALRRGLGAFAAMRLMGYMMLDRFAHGGSAGQLLRQRCAGAEEGRDRCGIVSGFAAPAVL